MVIDDVDRDIGDFKELPVLRGKQRVQTTMPSELAEAGRNAQITFQKALIFGMNFLLAEDDWCEYPPCKLMNKHQDAIKLLEESYEKNNKYEEKFGKLDEEGER